MSDKHWIKNPSPVKILLWVAALALGYVVVRTMYETGYRDSGVNYNLVVAADTINKKLPMMVDSETRLEKVVPDSRKLIFYLVLPGVKKEEMNLPVFRTNILQSVIADYKTNATKAGLRADGITMEYRFSDKEGNAVLRFAISPKDF
jgi:hypothetical protein